MANIANKYKLGVFVVSGVALTIIVFLLLGILKYFEPKIQFMTIAKDTVQGLDVGSKVKYRGVPIGSVVKIKINPEDDTILIYMEVFPSALDYNIKDNGARDAAFNTINDFLEAEIKKGLRCQLRYEGITGNLYQEISYFDPAKCPVPDYRLPESHPFYIPSAPSVFVANIMLTINESLVKISRINFDKISADLEESLAAVKKILNGPEMPRILSEIESISKNINDISKSINDTLTKERITKVVDDLSSTMTHIQNLSEDFQKRLDEAKIPELSADARTLMRTSDESMKSLVALRGQIEAALENLTDTLDSVKNLTQSIERDPTSLIRGKQEEAVVPP